MIPGEASPFHVFALFSCYLDIFGGWTLPISLREDPRWECWSARERVAAARSDLVRVGLIRENTGAHTPTWVLTPRGFSLASACLAALMRSELIRESEDAS